MLRISFVWLDQNKSIADDVKNNVKASDPTLPKANIKCKKYPKEFENEVILKKHLREDHIIVNVYNCTSCEYKTTTKEEFDDHVVARHPFLKDAKEEQKKDTDELSVDTNDVLQWSRCGFCEYTTKEANDLKHHESTQLV